jgi:maltose alpha-D-glucosyltransferase/alpha-amylase
MTTTLINWQLKGVDGFRADAVPYIWKEEGTICENLPKTHKVVQFFRAVLDELRPGTLLLAEACQPPKEVVDYFGEDNECNAAYHFPVMPRIYKALAEEKKDAIEMVMHSNFTPEIPENCQWFMFLRCHDELTLEMVTPEERRFIYDAYVKDPLWDFREGEGISARLSDLFERNIDKIMLAYSIMFTLLGTPIVYYGDEFAKANDYDYFDKTSAMTGYKDTRYLARGTIDWEAVELTLKDTASLGYKTFHGIKHMIKVRNTLKVFGRGSLIFLDVKDEQDHSISQVLAYTRSYMDEKVFVVQNLSSEPQKVTHKILAQEVRDLLGQKVELKDDFMILPPYGTFWLVQ